MRGKRVVVVVAVVGLLAATAARLLHRAATPAAPERRTPGTPVEPQAGRAPPVRPGDPVPPAAVRVAVYDAAGTPVPGAEVAAARDGDATPRRAEADAAGRAVFEGLDPAVDWVIAARAPGFAPTLVPGVRAGDFVQAVLTPGLRVHGVVRLPDRLPCPGARVRLTLRVPGAGSGSGGFETNADESGAYEFLRMPVVPFEIEATWNRSLGRSRSFAPAPNDADQRVDVVIEKGAVVGGTVRDTAGRPLAGIWLIARRPGRDRYDAHAESGADGRYALGGLDDGPYEVEASDPSNRRLAATVGEVMPPRTGLDFTLGDDPAAPGTYALRVVDAEGRPVPFLRVVEFLPGQDAPVGT
ncbi:MAG TPA: carboxypeptidase-like regulatory domain-containing protein, partial [Planctomycetota bacterium]|nr:carboxypeptidase-like regulatory domain-containing protein [Planctomycetota bacterium]